MIVNVDKITQSLVSCWHNVTNW